MKKIIRIVVWIVVLFVLKILDDKYRLIYFPSNMLDFQFNMLTISTVLIGFSFTVMGILFGFSSNELIKKLENTDYMQKNVNALMNSIAFFILSIVVSFVFVLGLNESIVNRMLQAINLNVSIDKLLFLWNVSLLGVGFWYFIKELKELSTLLQFIYKVKNKISKEQVKEFEDALDKSKIGGNKKN